MMQVDCSQSVSNECTSSIEQLNESKSDTTSLSSSADNQASSESHNAYETIKQAQSVISCLTERCDELERMTDGIPMLQKEIRSQIDQSMQMIQRALTERREFLLGELDAVLSSRNETITKMRTEFETRLQRLSSHVDLLKRLAQMSPSSTSSQSTPQGSSNHPTRNIALVKHKQEIEKILLLPVPLHPSEYDTMSFFPTELDQLLSMVRCVGVIGLTSIDAGKTTLAKDPDDEFSPIRRCLLNEEVRIDIITRDNMGRCITNPTSKEFTATLHSRNDYITEVRISDINDAERTGNPLSNYPSREQLTNIPTALQVAYRISTPGAYDLGIKLYGEHIQGSPYMIYARAPCTPDVRSWLETIREISEAPRRRHTVLVSRRRCKSAPSFSAAGDKLGALADINVIGRGDYLFSIGTKGRGEGEFANPTGVCVTRENKVLVADSNNASIQIFNTQAQFLFRIGEYGYHPGQLMRPMDVAETINGNYLVSDFELHCVTVYSPTGTYISRFGQRYLSGPKGIIADRNGRILVVDQKSCMLCIFKPTGKFINRFGARGSGDNQFTNPFSVAVNSQDEIYVSDYAQHAIKVFDQNGLYLFRFGEHGMEPGMLHAPTGLAFDKQDNLFVSDWGNNRVQVFDALGNFQRVISSAFEPFNGPQGLTFHTPTQRLFVTDPGNYCVKVFQPEMNAKGKKNDEKSMENLNEQCRLSSENPSLAQ
ncbi:hypothetical protein CRM22_010427 [Opisthorchis felineus]|uniref:B-box C-terminal domain-containing protein n=1 Tax=Opisthorchis felineus TaxID=147828 RepID=A0A4S2L4E3_OPIFE|nr:hypothetical protein CRM22_010427 [Opisthorchis felineus]